MHLRYLRNLNPLNLWHPITSGAETENRKTH